MRDLRLEKDQKLMKERVLRIQAEIKLKELNEENQSLRHLLNMVL